MHIAYTAPRDNKLPASPDCIADQNQLLLKRQAYYTACDKYRKEIAAIQKYLPGWVPPLPVI